MATLFLEESLNSLTSLVPGTDSSFWKDLLQFLSPFSSPITDKNDINSTPPCVSLGLHQLHAISIVVYQFLEGKPLELKAKIQRQAIEFESKLEVVQQKCEMLQESVQATALRNCSLESELKNIRHEVEIKDHQLIKISEERACHQKQISELESEVTNLHQEKRELLKLQGHHAQLETLQQDEYVKITQKYTDMRSELERLRSDTTLGRVDFIALQYEKERLEQKVHVATQQIEWYEKNFQECISDHLQQAQQKTQKIHTLLQQVDGLTQEKLALEATLKSCQGRNYELHNFLEESRSKVVELEAELQDQSITFQHELQVLKDLSDKHQKLSEESQKYAETMSQHVSASKASYLQLEREFALYRAESEKSLALLKEKHTKVKKKYQDILQSLCGGAEHAASVGSEEFIHLFSNSYATIKAQWSGKTYTELFELLITKENKLVLSETRNEELNEALQSIFTELEARAPLYQQLIKENEQFRLEKKNSQHQVLHQERDRLLLVKKLQQLEQESIEKNSQLNQLQERCSVLATQLIHLLSGVNADAIVEQLQLHEIVAAKSIPTMEKHIVFEDVESLVSQNQFLLQSLAESERKNCLLTSELQTCATAKKVDDLLDENKILKRNIENLKSEIEALKEKRPTALDMALPTATLNSIVATNPVEHLYTTRIKHLESVIATFETKLRNSDETLLAKEKSLVHVEAQLKYITLEKNQSLALLASVKEQVELLTSKSNNYCASIARWEEKNEKLQNDLHHAQKSYEDTKKSLSYMTLEKSDLEKSNSKLMEQLSRTVVERDMYSRMFSETQASLQLQVSQAQNENLVYRTQIQDLELRISSMAHKLEMAHANETRMVSKHAKEVQAVQMECLEKLSHVQVAATNFNSEEKRTKSETLTIQKPYEPESAKFKNDDELSAIDDIVEDSTKAQDQIKQLETDLRFLSNEVQQKDKNLNEILEHTRKLETQLAFLQSEQSEWFALEAELREQVNKAREEKNAMQCRLDDLETQLQDANTLSAEKSSTLEKMHTIHSECVTKQNEMEKELESMTLKYLREFQTHASDVQILETTKHTLCDVKLELNAAKLSLETALNEKYQAIKDCEVKLKASEKDLKQVELLLDNVRQQNEKLYSQIGQGEASAIIQLLRAERDALILEKETTLLESTRKIAQYEKLVDHLRSLQANTPITSDLENQIHVLNEKLKDQTTDMQLLRESNTTLRQERSHYEHLYQSRQSHLDQLESKVSTSCLQVAELEANVQYLKQEVAKYSNESQEWRHKYTNLFQEYERIDPEQHQALQSQVKEHIVKIEVLQSQLDAAEQRHQETIAKANANISKFKDSLSKNKEELRLKVESYASLEMERLEKIQQLESTVQELQKELEKAKDDAISKADELKRVNDAFEKKKQEVGILKTQLITFKMKLSTPSLPPTLPQPSQSVPIISKPVESPKKLLTDAPSASSEFFATPSLLQEAQSRTEPDNGRKEQVEHLSPISPCGPLNSLADPATQQSQPLLMETRAREASSSSTESSSFMETIPELLPTSPSKLVHAPTNSSAENVELIPSQPVDEQNLSGVKRKNIDEEFTKSKLQEDDKTLEPEGKRVRSSFSSLSAVDTPPPTFRALSPIVPTPASESMIPMVLSGEIPILPTDAPSPSAFNFASQGTELAATFQNPDVTFVPESKKTQALIFHPCVPPSHPTLPNIDHSELSNFISLKTPLCTTPIQAPSGTSLSTSLSIVNSAAICHPLSKVSQKARELEIEEGQLPFFPSSMQSLPMPLDQILACDEAEAASALPTLRNPQSLAKLSQEHEIQEIQPQRQLKSDSLQSDPSHLPQEETSVASSSSSLEPLVQVRLQRSNEISRTSAIPKPNSIFNQDEASAYSESQQFSKAQSLRQSPPSAIHEALPPLASPTLSSHEELKTGFEFKPIAFQPSPVIIKPQDSSSTRVVRQRQRGALPTVPGKRSGTSGT